ncbi:MAG TPA: Ivy family c-type lysozyme inhibitor [Rhizomicrobium sp.]
MSRIYRVVAGVIGLSCLLLLAGCSEPPPKYYGIYALDHGHFIELGDSTPEEKRLDFSPTVQILIFDKVVATPFSDSSQVTIKKRALVRYDVENVQNAQALPIKTVVTNSSAPFAVYPDLAKHFKPDDSNKEMLYAVPDKPLDAGLYVLTFNGKNYLFDVGLGATPEHQSSLSGCVDRYLKTEPMEGMRAFFLFGTGKARSASGNAILEETYKPCAERDAAARTESMIAAAIGGDWPKLRQLVEQGANPNAVDRSGITPLMDAILRSNGGDAAAEDTVKFLLEHGAEPFVALPSGQTPLHTAVQNARITAMLLDHGAPSSPLDQSGATPLFSAACAGIAGQGAAEVLIAHNAQINIGDNNGDTPLHCASAGGSIAVVKLLLAHGAAVNVTNKLGKTPLDKSIGHPEISAVLKAGGATGDIPIQLPYLYEQLRKPAYKATFLALFMGQPDTPPWVTEYIAALGGVEAPGKVVTIMGSEYEFYNVCQPHNCGDNHMYVLFTRDAAQAWAMSMENSANQRFFGNPDEVKQAFLSTADRQ